MPSLLQTEAVARAELITVLCTDVVLDLSAAGDRFTSRSTITFTAARPGVDTFVDLKAVELVSASLNGVPVPAADWTDGRLALTGLAKENELVIDSVMAYSSDGEGLHRHVDPADGETYLYAMSFLDAGPRWFACFDQPDLKSRYTFTVTAPAHWTVLGNGPSTEVAGGERDRRHPDLLDRSAAAVVDLLRHPGRRPVRLGATASTTGSSWVCTSGPRSATSSAAEADDLFEVTARCFDHYHRIFGVRYPFGEYHQAFVPDFNAGAMENPGCVTFRDSFIYRGRATRAERASRAGVVAHEMAHQWFGDLVTMRWWDDLWLNESFAEYLAHRTTGEATRYPLWTEFGIVRKDWGMVADQAPSTHPIAGNGAADAQSALRNFDGISYAKGAAVLQQLAALLGDEVFFGGLLDYFGRYAFGNAEFAELIECWVGAGAEGLDEWSRQWLLTSGVDEITVDRATDGAAVLTRRPAGSARPADRTHALAVAEMDTAGTEHARHRITLGAEPVRVEVAADRLVVPDAGDESWAKIRPTEADRDGLGRVLSAVVDPATRVSFYNSLRDQVRDAELDPAVALDLVCEQLPAETEEVIVARLLGFAQESLAGTFCPESARPDRSVRVAELALRILTEAEPGSDRQLVAFRAAVASGQPGEQLDRLRDWQAGRSLPAGLDLDAELRWSLVTRICALSDEPELIDQASAADPSGSGRVHAARARASLPHCRRQAGGLGADHGALGAERLRALRHRRRLLPAPPGRPDPQLRRPLLHRDRLHRPIPQRLVAGRGGQPRLPAVRGRSGHRGTG